MKTLLRKLVGHKYDTRFTWGELAPHFKYPKLALEYCPAGMFSHNTLIVAPLFFSVYLHLPTRKHGDGCMRDKEPQYGFYTIDQSIVWKWGTEYHSFSWPLFSFHHQSTEVLTLDRQPVWIEYSGKKQKDWTVRHTEEEAAKKANCFTTRYLYQLKSGKVQERTATVSVGRMTWGRKWFPFLKKIRTSIDVTFSDEVGERSGSWKGGCIGCGYDMLKNETPMQCLRRMERDRKF